jgi:hypothetical protein
MKSGRYWRCPSRRSTRHSRLDPGRECDRGWVRDQRTLAQTSGDLEAQVGDFVGPAPTRAAASSSVLEITNRTIIGAFTARHLVLRAAQPSPLWPLRLPKHVRYRCATPRRIQAWISHVTRQSSLRVRRHTGPRDEKPSHPPLHRSDRTCRGYRTCLATDGLRPSRSVREAGDASAASSRNGARAQAPESCSATVV